MPVAVRGARGKNSKTTRPPLPAGAPPYYMEEDFKFLAVEREGAYLFKEAPLAKTLSEENRKCTCEFLGTRVLGKPFLRNGFLLKKISEKPLQHFYHAAGIADCDGVGGYVFGDDGTRADDGAFADRDSGQNGDSAREPAAAAYRYRLGVFYVI